MNPTNTTIALAIAVCSGLLLYFMRNKKGVGWTIFKVILWLVGLVALVLFFGSVTGEPGEVVVRTVLGWLADVVWVLAVIAQGFATAGFWIHDMIKGKG